jgi:prevent-host-death family protein
MSGAISAAEANRSFSALLRRVRSGQSVLITSHGRPLARIVPVREGDPVASRARQTLLSRLAHARITRAGRWTRDELHER